MATFKSGSLTKDTYLEWIDTLQGHATDSGIWKYIDPAGTVLHKEPKKPEPSDYRQTASKYADLDDDEKAMYKEDNAQYRVDIQSFKHECKLIGEMRSRIVDSLQEHHRRLIFGHMTCQEVLKQVKNRLEPAEDLQRLKIIDDYSRARSTPSSKKIEMWLMEWERLDIMIKRLKIADFSDYKLIQDFLSSANSLLPMWVTSKRMEIVKESNKSNLKFLDVLLEFRQFWALTEFETESSISAFPATLQNQEQLPIQPKSSNNNRGKQQDNSKPRLCICGKVHLGQDCFYLAEGKAPSDFDRDEDIVNKFKDACNRTAFRGFIRKADWTAKWLKDFVEKKWSSNNRSSGNQESSNQQTNSGTFVTSSGITTLTTRLSHPLKNEILLDNGADGHVCNNLALAVSPLKTPKTPTYVQAGAGTCPIMGYGDMVFDAHLGNGETYKMTLTNVAFAPEFLTSVVSWKALKRKGVKWNSDTNVMTFNGQLICQLLDRHNHDVFTENPLPEIQTLEPTAMVNSTNPRKSIGSEYIWHQRLGHPGPGSVQHIKSDTVKINEKGPKTIECKDCALNKATKIISRRPTERALIPFERVHFDLVTYSPLGFDGSRYMLHFCDDMSRMNFVYLLTNRSGPNLLRHFKNFVAYTKRQFRQDVRIFRCDQESGLGRAFEEWIAELGIVVEWSAVKTSEQNGQSERSGGVIQTKARCLGNSANLPKEYWPEFVMTAAYLINRSPTSSLSWLSPLSKLRQALKIPERDEYSHLKAFGCTAYALDKSIAKGDKMKPRAKTGFLVGYNSRNIYRILLLGEEVVIGTRDVVFDETQLSILPC